MRIEKSDVALAMLAGADAIENNRNLKTRFFVRDPDRNKKGVIPYLFAAAILKDAAKEIFSELDT